MKSLPLEANLRLALTDGLPVLAVDDSVEPLLGYAAKDFLSAQVSIKQLIHAHDAEIADALFVRGSSQRSGVVSLRLRHADGRILCFLANFSRKNEGKRLVLSLHLQDVKTIPRKPNELRLSANLRVLLENSAECICYKNRNHVISAASQALASLIDPEKHWVELLGQTDYDLLPEAWADTNYLIEKDLLAGKLSAQEIMEIPAEDQQIRTLDCRFIPLLGRNKQVVSLCCVAQETTALRNTEETLLECRRALDEMRETISSGDLSALKIPASPQLPSLCKLPPIRHDSTAKPFSHYSSAQPILAAAHESVERIRQALAANEFVMYYQPKVNMSTGAVVGAEALIRWLHPEKGILPPVDFLPIIQNHPLAVELGEWVFHSVLKQMDLWRDSGLEIQIGINVGALHLQQPDFVARLAALLAEHPRIMPSNLELDILETSAPKEQEQLTALLTGCREIGVSIALDDFGAGHSSLDYLKRLTGGVLKIDPSFVRHIVERPEDLSILEGMLGLAASFRRQSVAEGVETADQGLMLLRLGCELAQGYGIAYPMPPEQFPDWIATWRPDPRWAKALLQSHVERPLLRTGVEHRAWILSIEALLKGETQIQPHITRHQCGLGNWLDSQGQSRSNDQQAFQAITALHWRMHALASGILKLHAQGKTEEALTRILELHDLLDKLLEQLKELGFTG